MIIPSDEDRLEELKHKWVRKFAWFPVQVSNEGRYIWLEKYAVKVNSYFIPYGEPPIVIYTYLYGDDLANLHEPQVIKDAEIIN